MENLKKKNNNYKIKKCCYFIRFLIFNGKLSNYIFTNAKYNSNNVKNHHFLKGKKNCLTVPIISWII